MLAGELTNTDQAKPSAAQTCYYTRIEQKGQLLTLEVTKNCTLLRESAGAGANKQKDALHIHGRDVNRDVGQTLGQVALHDSRRGSHCLSLNCV